MNNSLNKMFKYKKIDQMKLKKLKEISEFLSNKKNKMKISINKSNRKYKLI